MKFNEISNESSGSDNENQIDGMILLQAQNNLEIHTEIHNNKKQITQINKKNKALENSIDNRNIRGTIIKIKEEIGATTTEAIKIIWQDMNKKRQQFIQPGQQPQVKEEQTLSRPLSQNSQLKQQQETQNQPLWAIPSQKREEQFRPQTAHPRLQKQQQENQHLPTSQNQPLLTIPSQKLSFEGKEQFRPQTAHPRLQKQQQETQNFPTSQNQPLLTILSQELSFAKGEQQFRPQTAHPRLQIQQQVQEKQDMSQSFDQNRPKFQTKYKQGAAKSPIKSFIRILFGGKDFCCNSEAQQIGRLMALRDKYDKIKNSDVKKNLFLPITLPAKQNNQRPTTMSMRYGMCNDNSCETLEVVIVLSLMHYLGFSYNAIKGNLESAKEIFYRKQRIQKMDNAKYNFDKTFDIVKDICNQRQWIDTPVLINGNENDLKMLLAHTVDVVNFHLSSVDKKQQKQSQVQEKQDVNQFVVKKRERGQPSYNKDQQLKKHPKNDNTIQQKHQFQEKPNVMNQSFDQELQSRPLPENVSIIDDINNYSYGDRKSFFEISKQQGSFQTKGHVQDYNPNKQKQQQSQEQNQRKVINNPEPETHNQTYQNKYIKQYPSSGHNSQHSGEVQIEEEDTLVFTTKKEGEMLVYTTKNKKKKSSSSSCGEVEDHDCLGPI